MMRGDMPETAPTLSDSRRLPSNVNISSQEWQSLVYSAYIWLDYISVRLSMVIRVR